MITPSGKIETSKKSKARPETKGKKKRSEAGKEKALERMEKLHTKTKRGEERVVSVAFGFGLLQALWRR